MSSTLLHKNVFSILSEINNTPEVHAYLDRLCGDAVALMHAYAVHEATQQSAVWGCMDFDVFESTMHEQHKMCSTPTPYRSGSVHTRDVPEVLQRGNIRERCYVLSNILSRRSHLWRFVVQCCDPSFMPHICRARAADLLGEHKEVCNGHLTRIHAEPTKQVWVTPTQKQFSVREARKESYERDNLRPRPCDIVPNLSARERAVFSYCTCKNTRLRTWITGHMQWVVREDCILAIDAARVGENLVAGISGHTDLFNRGICAFDYFDVRMSTLICAVWLVGCDHHSLYEVIRTAMFYGLKACTEPCVPYLRQVLAAVQGQRCLCGSFFGTNLCMPLLYSS